MIKRIAWFDTAKGIGIILVVFGHVLIGLINAQLLTGSNTAELLRSMIYSFHMPLFFIIAGVLFANPLSNQAAKDLLLNRLSTVLYPYIAWSLLQGSIELFAQSYKNNPVTVNDILSLLWEPRSHFWFLYELFLFSIFAIFLSNKTWKTTVFFSVGLALYCSGEWGNEWSTWRYLKHNLVYFFTGILTAHYLFNWRCSRNMLGLLGGSFIAFQYVFHITLDRYFLDKSLMSFALAIVSFLFIAALSQRLNKGMLPEFLKLLGRHSLAIYLIHILVLASTRTLLIKLFGIEDVLTHMIVATLFALCVPLVISLLAERYHCDWLFRFPRKATRQA